MDTEKECEGVGLSAETISPHQGVKKTLQEAVRWEDPSRMQDRI